MKFFTRDRVPTVELRRHLLLTSISALLVRRRLCWFGHVARRPEGELIKNRLLPLPPCTWWKLMSWMPTEDLGYDTRSRPRTSLCAARFRLRTMVKWLDKKFQWAHTASSNLGCLTWQTPLMMPAQPASCKCRHNYKKLRLPFLPIAFRKGDNRGPTHFPRNCPIG